MTDTAKRPRDQLTDDCELRTRVFYCAPVKGTYKWYFARDGRRATPEDDRVVLGHSHWQCAAGRRSQSFTACQPWLNDLKRPTLKGIREELARLCARK